jgi:putative peptidoglycan lipid II flippase
VREIVQAMVPIVLGLSITQVNTCVDSLIAWGLSAPHGQPGATLSGTGWAYPLEAGAVSALYYGERMYQFPLGVFGVALGTVLFPLLARHAARGELGQLREDLTLGLKLVLVIGVPAGAGLMFLAEPISAALLEHGAFQPGDTLRAARTTAAYGSGVWAYCGLLILQRGFYAIGDRLTPLRIGVAAVGLNLVFNLTLIWFLAEVGLALSTALCATLQVAALIWCLQLRIGRLAWKEIGRTLGRTLGATAVMTAAGLGMLAWQTELQVLDGRLGRLLAPLIVSVLAFVLAAQLLRLEEFWLLLRRGRRS